MWKRLNAVILSIVFAAGMIACAQVNAETEKEMLSYEGYSQIWSDEFDTGELDRSSWNVELHDPGWVNEELQSYVDSENNIRLENGMLYIVPIAKKNDLTGKYNYTSGRITTQNKEDFTYGLFEVRAKVPEGKGFLPAFWLMATDENIYGQWPRCGEIDCMEVMGQDTQKAYGTIHYGNPHAESQGIYTLSGNDSFSNDFHVYSCEWLPGQINWYIDGQLYHTERDWYSTTEGLGTLTYPAPFDQPFYIILNLAVGGSWVGNPDRNTSFDNNPYIIDYVRVYQKDSYDENVSRPVKETTLREAGEDGNYITDNNWTFLQAQGGKGTSDISHEEIVISTEKQGTVDYSIQLVQPDIPLVKGAEYEVSFDACAEEERTMNVDMKAPDRGWKCYMPTQNPPLTQDITTFTYTFVMNNDTDPNGRLEFNMGATNSKAEITLSNISVKKITDPDPNIKEIKTVLSNGNYIYNGGFQEGEKRLGSWIITEAGNVSVTDFADGRRLKVTGPVTISQEDLTFLQSSPYVLTFSAQADKPGTVTMVVGGNIFEVEISSEKNEYMIKLPETLEFTDKTVSISFTGEETVYIDNIKLTEDAMIKNGSFTDGLVGYEVYVDSSAKATYVVDSLSEENALDVTINDTGDKDWKVQVKQNNVTLEKGKSYRLTFSAKSDTDRYIRVILQGQEKLGWPVYSGDKMAHLSDEFKTFTVTFTMEFATDTEAFLSICLGDVGAHITTQHRVIIDNISLVEIEPDT